MRETRLQGARKTKEKKNRAENNGLFIFFKKSQKIPAGNFTHHIQNIWISYPYQNAKNIALEKNFVPTECSGTAEQCEKWEG